ncbi:type III secretion system stator protein SctL [Methylorubrum podarium]|uniref:type III secretion system stator protein SctL n=1 Tax=Methylorubrum podarium TaxID=200476 RepID=UPI001EE1D6A6|nr:type III secretion system stator protein SctL [Methylorubrum podarium]GJE73391.1 Yop proteins translocation protein L [Methylorubrum podarium]
MPERAQPTTPRLRPAGPIVRAAEIGIWSEAQAGLAASHRHAVETRAFARDLVERERARAEAEGRAAGEAAAAARISETAARAAAHLAALERELPGLVHGLVAEILGDFEPGDRLVRSVRQAIARLRPDAEASLRVAPGDLETVRAGLADLDTGSLRIEADPVLQPGECCLRSAIGSVELGLEAQLRALRAGLSAASGKSAS